MPLLKQDEFTKIQTELTNTLSQVSQKLSDLQSGYRASPNAVHLNHIINTCRQMEYSEKNAEKLMGYHMLLAAELLYPPEFQRKAGSPEAYGDRLATCPLPLSEVLSICENSEHPYEVANLFYLFRYYTDFPDNFKILFEPDNINLIKELDQQAMDTNTRPAILNEPLLNKIVNICATESNPVVKRSKVQEIIKDYIDEQKSRPQGPEF